MTFLSSHRIGLHRHTYAWLNLVAVGQGQNRVSHTYTTRLAPLVLVEEVAHSPLGGLLVQRVFEVFVVWATKYGVTHFVWVSVVDIFGSLIKFYS